MATSRKKLFMMSIITIGCIVLAVFTSYKTLSQKSGIDTLKRGTMIWVKCSNPDCGAEYQMDLVDYHKALKENMSAESFSTPPIRCRVCGKNSVYRAIKCEKCGLVFFYGAVRGDYPDKCPRCGHRTLSQP